MQRRNLHREAYLYHKRLPPYLREYLESLGIAEGEIYRQLLGWNGCRITIPLFDRAGRVTSFVLLKGPDDPAEGPELFTVPGSDPELYGWEVLAALPEEIVFCRDVLECLILRGRGFAAIAASPGPLHFKEGWVKHLLEAERIYLCFGTISGARAEVAAVGRLLPTARVIELPAAIPTATAFFRGGGLPEIFRLLFERARPVTESLP